MSYALRILLLWLCLGGIALWSYNTFYVHPRTGGAGTLLRRENASARLIVYPGSAAAAAGLHTDDEVELRAASPADRWMYGHFVGAGREPFGSRVAYYVERGGTLKRVNVLIANPMSESGHARQSQASFIDRLFRGSVPWMLFSGAFIFWRARENRAMILGCLLLCWGLGNQLWQSNLWTPWLGVNVLADVVDKALDSAQIVLIAVYAMSFGQQSAWRRASASALAAAALVNFCWACTLDVSIVAAPSIYLHVPWLIGIWPAILAGAGILLIVTIGAAGRERDVFVWSALPISAVCVLQSFGTSLYALNNSPLRTAANYAVEIGFLILPLGLTYAIFSRRVLDVNFVLNRAAVFSGVSVVIVGIFVILEWLLSRWLENTSHAESLAIDGALALALGMSIRFVHARVEHLLDTIFFRKRHEDEKAIRTLAREAPFFTDSGVLVRRTIDVLAKHTGASRVAFVDADGDDPVTVAMRATHERVDIRATAGTAIDGEWAYPLVARGVVWGAIVLGPKRSGESYAPDESESISQLAAAVAHALESSAPRGDDRLTRIEALLERLLAYSSHQSLQPRSAEE